jgi:hypothetical protein
MPNWELRYFSFNQGWDVEADESMASMRDGEGQSYFIVFSPAGAIGKVYDPQIGKIDLQLEHIPSCFSSFLNEPAFDIGISSYLFWFQKDDENWSTLANNEASFEALSCLNYSSEQYVEWAEIYYDGNWNRAALIGIFETLSINDRVIANANVNLSMADLEEDIFEILG